MKPHTRKQRGARPTSGQTTTPRTPALRIPPKPRGALWEVTYRDGADAQCVLATRAETKPAAIAELWRLHPLAGFVSASLVLESAAQAAPLHSPPEAGTGEAEGTNTTIDNALTLRESQHATRRRRQAGMPR